MAVFRHTGTMRADDPAIEIPAEDLVAQYIIEKGIGYFGGRNLASDSFIVDKASEALGLTHPSKEFKRMVAGSFNNYVAIMESYQDLPDEPAKPRERIKSVDEVFGDLIN